MICNIKRHDAKRTRTSFLAIGITTLCTVCPAAPVPAATSTTTALAMPTFHCLSVYWSPEQGGRDKQVFVKNVKEHGIRLFINKELKTGLLPRSPVAYSL